MQRFQWLAAIIVAHPDSKVIGRTRLSQPMNITWRLEEPLPPYLWNDAAKLALG